MDSVSFLAAFGAGLISFLSPCVLPLVPGYISMVSGISLDQLKNEPRQKALNPNVIMTSIMFIIGFSLTFIALGASATWLGQALAANRTILYKIAGVVIILFGLHQMGILKIKALYRDKRFNSMSAPSGMIGAMLLGGAFAFGWSPCLGPILATILTVASTRETISDGIVLLSVYSLGLGVPFLLTSLGLDRFLAFYARFKRHFHAVEVASGVLMVLIGILIFTNDLSRLSAYFSFLNRFAL